MAKPTTPYSALSGPNCIRILSITPASSNVPLSCTLEELDLANLPLRYCSYSALSYRWGNEAPVFNISLNGCSIPVRENLHQFLQHARDAGWYNNLWIDAVCINQDDKAEKVQQIGIMGAVYSLASHILIWLGRLSSAEVVALEEIRDAEDRIKPLRKQYGSSWQNHHPHLGWYKPWLELVSPTALRGLKKLIANPYWSRKWIIQEILLGCPNVSIVSFGTQIRLGDLGGCLATLISQFEHERHQGQLGEVRDAHRNLTRSMRGGQSSDGMWSFDESTLSTFSEWASYYRERNWEDWREETYHSNNCCRSPSALEKVLENFSTPQMTHRPDSLVNLVEEYSESFCSEPWDNVYALLGLAKPLSPPIAIDYALDRADIYWRFLLDVSDAGLYEESPGITPAQVSSLYTRPRSLQKAMRLDNGDVGRSLSRLWESNEMTTKWEFQFIEAMRHVFSELRVSDVGSKASSTSTLPKFELDYFEARKLPPSPSARVTMGELFRYIWPLHLSVVNGVEPVLLDLGLRDYTIFKVMQGTSLDPLHHFPQRSSKIGQQTLDIYDYGSAPVLTSAIRHGRDDRFSRLHHIILQYWDKEKSIGPQFSPNWLRLRPNDLLLMFNGHQVALAARRVSSEEVLCGVVGTCNFRLAGKISFFKPHCTVHLANWGKDAKDADWIIRFRG